MTLKIANSAISETHRFTVGTSNHDGYMYLQVEDMTTREVSSIKLDDESRSCLRKVLGPTENWTGIF